MSKIPHNIPQKKRVEDFALSNGKLINPITYGKIAVETALGEEDKINYHDPQYDRKFKERMDEIKEKYNGDPYKRYPPEQYKKEVEYQISRDDGFHYKDKVFSKQDVAKEQAQKINPRFLKPQSYKVPIRTPGFLLGRGKKINSKSYAKIAIDNDLYRKYPGATPTELYDQKQNIMKKIRNEYGGNPYKLYPIKQHGAIVRQTALRSPRVWGVKNTDVGPRR